MQSQLIRRVLVLDRDKRLAGIVSLGDLAIEDFPRHEALGLEIGK